MDGWTDRCDKWMGMVDGEPLLPACRRTHRPPSLSHQCTIDNQTD